jgi:Protein of unknown function (DUF3352)
MKRVKAWLGALALVLNAASLAHAQIKDPADLLPAQTLACVEFRHPDKLARETGMLIKGSSLEDMAATMAKFRAKLGKDERWWFFSEIGMMGLFVSPEMLSEFSRFQGGTLALTGVSKDKGPQWVGILLSGESNIPGLYMRAWVTLSDEMRSAGETEGVTVYREHSRVFVAPAPGQPPPQEKEGIAAALMPGMLIFGSSPEQVQGVIRRAKGKTSDPALSNVRAFKDAAKLRERPGIYAYSDLEALAGQMDDAIKTLGPQQKAEWSMFKTIVNPRAFRAATASLTVLNGNIELQAQVKIVPGQTSPLLDLLPDKKADVQLFQYVPRDHLVALSAGLGDGEKRWAKIVELIDALAKNAGQSDLNLPSKAIKEAQDDLKLDIGKDIFGKIKGVILGGALTEDAGTPLCVIQTTDDAAAKYLTETGLPKLARLGANEAAAPKRVEIEGWVIHSVSVRGLAGLVPLPDVFYGSHGDVVVVGGDAARVVAALKSGSKKTGLLSEAKYATALKEADGSITVGVVLLGSAIVSYFKDQESNQNQMAVPLRPNAPGGQPPAPPAPKLNDRAAKAVKELTQIVEPLPPLLFSLNRKDDAVVLEARQLGLKTVSTKLIDLWIDSALERQGERMGRNFGPGGGVKVAPPPPPAPPKEVKKDGDNKDKPSPDKDKDKPKPAADKPAKDKDKDR